MRSLKTSGAAVFLLLVLAGPGMADGFHSPLLRNRNPRTWAATLREQLGLDRSDSAEELPGGRMARPAVADRLVNVLKYLQKKNVLLREFPDFNYDDIPGFKSETEAILIAMGADAVPTLLHALVTDLKGGAQPGLAKCSDFIRRVKRILIAIGKPAVPGLIGRLTDKDVRVRSAMLEVLKAIVVEPHFGDRVEDWQHWYRIWRAGQSRIVAEIPALLASLEDPDLRIRVAAVEALGRIGRRSALPGLLKILGKPVKTPFLREVIRAIVRIGDRSAVPHLIALLEDSRPDIRREAVVGLRFLTHEMLGFSPRGSLAERREAVGRWLSWWESQRR